MRIKTLFILLTPLALSIWCCTPNRGCTELTADNYDQAAEENDGTCIPSRDKMIGTFTYTRFWTDVILGKDTVDKGSFTITESNTASNAFVLKTNKNLILRGTTSAYLINLKQISVRDTFSGQFYDHSYSGDGTWLKADSVNFTLKVITQVPQELDGGNPPKVLTVPQTYDYYCKKVK